MKALGWVLAAANILLVSACGSPGANNVAACKKWVTAAACGSVDISASFPCENYANTTCDISAYFDCATAHYVCVNGTYDSAKLSTFGADCAAKAACR